MRLTPEPVRIIQQGIAHIFGANSQVRLFGSRANDALKGGAIGLYIQVSKNYRQPFKSVLSTLSV